MRKKQKRMTLFFGAFVLAATALFLTLTALKSSVTYFYTPQELAALDDFPARPIRLGGLVADNSVRRLTQSSMELVAFTVTDGASEIEVSYAGLLPDLFREGQGVVVQGRMTGPTTMTAENVLAKHDENYMPREVADALEEQGFWKGDKTGS